MSGILVSLFSYEFAARALIAGTAVSVCAALLGVVLTLRRYTMLGDGLSHTAFGAVAVAAAVGWSPYWVTLAVTVAVSFLILRQDCRKAGDNLVAVVSTSSLAIGIIVTSSGSGVSVNMNEYLFGSVLSMTKGDVAVSLALSLLVLAVFILCHRAVFGITFDEGFCKASGVSTDFYGRLLAALTAVTVVVGMKVVGALLMTNLLIYPAVSSMKLLRNFKGVLILASAVSVLCFFAGIAASCIFGTPAGAGIVVANIIFFAVFSAAGRLRHHKWKPKDAAGQNTAA